MDTKRLMGHHSFCFLARFVRKNQQEVNFENIIESQDPSVLTHSLNKCFLIF